MIEVTINGQLIEVQEGITVLQACEIAGIEIPVFCYHPKLSIAGNCRMCLVEVKGAPKLAASCAMPVANGMVIDTLSDKVRHAREGNLELMLINHPLDCPICDQAGECDLQDITHKYSRGKSRFDLNKRAVPNKYMGPLVKTVMTRCIHCTRCIRFSNEIAGTPEMGAIGRGEDTEITSYLEQTLSSELSGNVIDICPVGALTNKPYAFHGRPWELKETETIDVMDAVGSHIHVDSKARKVMRVLPRLCEEINEEWISDVTRFSYDGLDYQRLDQPYVRVNDKLTPCRWEEAYASIASAIKQSKPDEMATLSGDLVDCESLFMLAQLWRNLGSPHLDCRQDGTNWPAESRAHYIFNTTIAGIEEADVCPLIGTNPRLEAPLINARIRKSYLQSGLKVAAIGPQMDLNYPVEYLSDSPTILNQLVSGKHEICETLKNAKKPMVIVGQEVLKRKDVSAILSTLQIIMDNYNFIQDDWNGFNILHQAAARVGGLDLGFLPEKNGWNTSEILTNLSKIKVLYLLGADEINLSAKPKDTFIIYQGHHGEHLASIADVILPGATYTEKDATYVNTEGRSQRAYAAVTPPGQAKEDWLILKELSQYVGQDLSYNSLKEVREGLEACNPRAFSPTLKKTTWIPIKQTKEQIDAAPIVLPERSLYMNNIISRHSTIMAQCYKEFQQARGAK